MSDDSDPAESADIAEEENFWGVANADESASNASEISESSTDNELDGDEAQTDESSVTNPTEESIDDNNTKTNEVVAEYSPARAKAILDEDFSEFIIRESKSGDQAHSLLVDEDLIRVVRITRNGEELDAQTDLMLKREAFQGFSHRRVDWLDSGVSAWWLITMMGLGALLTGNWWGLIPLLCGGALSAFQLADPEVITFQSSGQNHRLIIWRWGSNRPLTAASMNRLDSSVRGVLNGGDLDTAELDELALQYDAERRKAKQIAAERKAARQAEKIAKAEEKARLNAEAAAAAEAEAAAAAAIPLPAFNPTPITEPSLVGGEAPGLIQQPAHPLPHPPTETIEPSQEPMPELPPPPVLDQESPPEMAPMPAPTPPPGMGMPAPTPAPPPGMGMPAPAPPPGMGMPAPAPLPPAGIGMPPPPMGAAPVSIDSLDLGLEPTDQPPKAPVPAGERVDTMSTVEKDELLNALGD
jgi:hypothetical protein